MHVATRSITISKKYERTHNERSRTAVATWLQPHLFLRWSRLSSQSQTGQPSFADISDIRMRKVTGCRQMTQGEMSKAGCSKRAEVRSTQSKRANIDYGALHLKTFVRISYSAYSRTGKRQLLIGI